MPAHRLNTVQVYGIRDATESSRRKRSGVGLRGLPFDRAGHELEWSKLSRLSIFARNELSSEEALMIRCLLFWTLAIMLNAPLLAVGDEPDDPYAWLEDVAGEKALAWVKERNAESTSELTKSERFQALERRILEILDSDARIPTIQKIGPYYYNFWRDAKNPRGLWRRTTLEEYRKAKPNWEVVLDLDALGKEEKENWVWHGAQVLRPEYKLALISLSRGGADASVTREFDLSSQVVRQGRLPTARGQEPGRLARRRTVSSSARTSARARLTESGYPRIVKEWKRGRRWPRPSWSSRASRATWASPPSETSRPASSAISSSARRPSGPPNTSCDATASSSRSRSPTMPGPPCIASGSCCTCAPTGRSTARRIRPAP